MRRWRKENVGRSAGTARPNVGAMVGGDGRVSGAMHDGAAAIAHLDDGGCIP